MIRKVIAYFLYIAVLLSLFGCSGSNYNAAAEREELSEKLLERAAEAGLTDVSFTTSSVSVSGYTLYHYSITCSNFESFSYPQMLQIAKKLGSISTSGNSYSLETVYCNGNKYTIYTYTNSIYKNGKEVYDDYSNSESHKSAENNTGGSNNDKNAKDDYGHDRFDAFVVAKKKVSDNLKAPSTAVFCSTSQATITCKNNKWTVTGWVDAQNSYGATLRSNFTVTFTFLSKDKYTVNSCVID